MEREQPRRQYTCLYVCAFIAYIVAIVAIGLFVYPTTTVTPTPPSPQPTSSSLPTPPPPPQPTSSSPPVARSSCQCGPDEQPIYDSFPHPAHTDESFAVFNFYNDGAIDENGENMTVWVSMYITADPRMAATDSRFKLAYTYVYVDAVPVARGELFTYTMSKGVTANGAFASAPEGAGRAPGGRIVIYYKNPRDFDTLRNTNYIGGYPLQTANAIIPITNERGEPATPSPSYSQLLEFTMDVDPGRNANEFAFIDYDLSAVDTIALPVYIFGGADNRTLRGATSGNSNNGFPCGKAYIGCQHTHETTDGCPTQVVESTPQGSACQSPITYCAKARPTTLQNDNGITNKTNWQYICQKFDNISAGFGITQELLDFYFACGDPNQPTPASCPPKNPGDITTPSGIIYGCNGKFLLENQCNDDGSRYTRSRLDGSQCSAINRGLCVQPNYHPIPPQGLSCAEFTCPQNPSTSCFINCTDDACFGFLCQNYSQTNAFSATCDGATCQVGGATPNCLDRITPKEKFKTPTCNDSSPNPYERGLLQNDYAAWARSKGERYYAFSLDEEIGGGNQQCLYSTQLDIVIFPRCNGNYVPPSP